MGILQLDPHASLASQSKTTQRSSPRTSWKGRSYSKVSGIKSLIASAITVFSGGERRFKDAGFDGEIVCRILFVGGWNTKWFTWAQFWIQMNHSKSVCCLLQVHCLLHCARSSLDSWVSHSHPVWRNSASGILESIFMHEIQRSLNYLCFEMDDKADVVVGNVVNKPTDILFTNVAFIFVTAPLTTWKHRQKETTN